MKQSPHEKSRHERLEPSRFSAGGFLGTDDRPVDEIIADDLRALDRLGVTRETLACALRNTYQKARDAFGAEIEIRPGVSAVFHESMGRIPSPFRGDGVFPKGEAVVTDNVSGSTLRLSALGIALIEKHGFFQGGGSAYRIDPAAAVRMLDVRS
ncbi:MAG: hypothetical protein GF418_11460 [Chitinivibrionales bacterium]|nr:hypothetical protein [Chitinivibrionales bacterium]MBD3396232.1 hypothetical protein [Chitinivibrionales bacterium]